MLLSFWEVYRVQVAIYGHASVCYFPKAFAETDAMVLWYDNN